MAIFEKMFGILGSGIGKRGELFMKVYIVCEQWDAGDGPGTVGQEVLEVWATREQAEVRVSELQSDFCNQVVFVEYDVMG